MRFKQHSCRRMLSLILLLLLRTFAWADFSTIISDKDRLHSTNICHMAFILTDEDAVEAVHVLQSSLNIAKKQSKIINSKNAGVNLLTEFNTFARHVDSNRPSLFVVGGLDNVHEFLPKMHFLHSVTDSNSEFANVVVLLLWNVTSSALMDLRIPITPAVYTEKWRQALHDSHAQHSGSVAIDVNVDALLGRISRMQLFPMQHYAGMLQLATNNSIHSLCLHGAEKEASSIFVTAHAMLPSYVVSILTNPRNTPQILAELSHPRLALLAIFFIIIFGSLCFCLSFCCCSGNRKLKKSKEKLDPPIRKTNVDPFNVNKSTSSSSSSNGYSNYSPPPTNGYGYQQQQQHHHPQPASPYMPSRGSTGSLLPPHNPTIAASYPSMYTSTTSSSVGHKLSSYGSSSQLSPTPPYPMQNSPTHHSIQQPYGGPPMTSHSPQRAPGPVPMMPSFPSPFASSSSSTVQQHLQQHLLQPPLSQYTGLPPTVPGIRSDGNSDTRLKRPLPPPPMLTRKSSKGKDGESPATTPVIPINIDYMALRRSSEGVGGALGLGAMRKRTTNANSKDNNYDV